MPSLTDSTLSEPYRAVRPVPAGTEAPWPGTIGRQPSDESALLVDADDLPDGWHGWSADPRGHVVAPKDVIRRTGGHAVLLDSFGSRVDDFLDRRHSGRTVLDPGEAVTLAVSVLRGLAELGPDASTTRAEWWLTDAGRPVLATESGDASAVDSSAHILEALAPALGAAVSDDLRAALARPRWHPSDVERLEAALFALAEPAPLAAPPLQPRSARSLGGVTQVVDAPSYDPAIADEAPRAWFDHLARHVDADVADLVSRATTGVWRRLSTRRPPGRKRPWIVGAVLAAGIVSIGVLWPGGGPATAEPAPGVTSSAAVPEPAEPESGPEPTAPSSAEPASTGTPQDLAAITMTLLTERTDCASDPACLATVMADATDLFPRGAIDLPADERTAVLVDEFGGVAVIRIDVAAGGGAQLAVIESDGSRWLLRDVYDARQPDG